MQTAAPAAAPKFPAAHLKQAEAPAVEDNPMPQFEQAVEPEAAAYWPAAQDAQAPKPTEAPTVPARQAEQAAAPLAE